MKGVVLLYVIIRTTTIVRSEVSYDVMFIPFGVKGQGTHFNVIVCFIHKKYKVECLKIESVEVDRVRVSDIEINKIK